MFLGDDGAFWVVALSVLLYSVALGDEATVILLGALLAVKLVELISEMQVVNSNERCLLLVIKVPFYTLLA
jgi:hypothetical protein